MVFFNLIPFLSPLHKRNKLKIEVLAPYKKISCDIPSKIKDVTYSPSATLRGKKNTESFSERKHFGGCDPTSGYLHE